MEIKTERLLQPFAGDSFIEKKILEFKEKFEIVSAVETGTFLGGTFRWLYNNFEKVYSCEVNPEFYQLACNRIFNSTEKNIVYPNVIKNPVDMGELTFANIDSESFIQQIGASIDNQTLFFLDAHWYSHCPLLSELDVISDLNIKPAVISIHDFKTDHPEELGYDSYNSQEFTLDWIQRKIDKIYNKKWTYEYNTPNKAEGAMRGIIYITGS